MDPKTKNFVIGLTTELWATVYKKRKLAIVKPLDHFDLAAKINQHTWMNLGYQDEKVKELFRDFVEYVEKVGSQTAIIC